MFFIMLFAMLCAVFAGTYTYNTAKSSAVDAAVSAKWFCSATDLGVGMVNKGDWKPTLVNIPADDVGGRTLTAQEAFGGNVGYVVYYGEGEGTAWTQSVENSDQRNVGNQEAVKDKLEATRNGSTCLEGLITTPFGNLQVAISSFIASFGQMVSTAAFDPTIFCKDANDTKCINVAGIVGGEGNNTGIIGALTSGILIPLSTLMALIAGVVIAVTRFRTPMQGLKDIAMLVAVYIVGVMVASSPQTVARAPLQAAAIISQAVISPFVQGTSISDNGTVQGNGICVSNASNASADAKMAMTISQLNCTAWKAFVLEPYAQSQFGRAYSDLELSNPDIASAVEKGGFTADDFSVPLGTSRAPQDMYGKTLQLDVQSPVVQNIALYQLYLKTNAAKPGDEQYLTAPIDTRWYRVILTTANNDSMWNSYAYSGAGLFHKMGLGFISLIATAAGTFIIVFVSILALAWLFISMIALSLLPLFILLGLEPKYGRRIAKTYAWDIFNSIIKYFVSLVFVILTIVMYGAILSTISNPGTLLLAVIILTAALLMYRKNIMGMFGDMNMFSAGNVGGRVGKFASKLKDRAVSASGGGMGAAIAEQGLMGALNPKNAKSTLGSFSRGAMSTTKRELKRGNGFLANTIRERDRISDDNRKDLRERTEHVRNDLQDNQKRIQDLASEYGQKQAETQGTNEQISDLQQAQGGLVDQAKLVHETKEEVLLTLDANTAGGALFAKQQGMANELANIETEIGMADYLQLSDEEIAERRARAEEIRQSLDASENIVLPDGVQAEKDRAKAEYEQRLASELTGLGVSGITPELASQVMAYNNEIAQLLQLHHAQELELDRIAQKHAEVVASGAELAQQYENMRETSLNWKPGQFMGRDAVEGAIGKNLSKEEIELHAEANGLTFDEARDAIENGAYNRYMEENSLAPYNSDALTSDTIIHGANSGADIERDRTTTEPMPTAPLNNAGAGNASVPPLGQPDTQPSDLDNTNNGQGAGSQYSADELVTPTAHAQDDVVRDNTNTPPLFTGDTTQGTPAPLVNPYGDNNTETPVEGDAQLADHKGNPANSDSAQPPIVPVTPLGDTDRTAQFTPPVNSDLQPQGATPEADSVPLNNAGEPVEQKPGNPYADVAVSPGNGWTNPNTVAPELVDSGAREPVSPSGGFVPPVAPTGQPPVDVQPEQSPTAPSTPSAPATPTVPVTGQASGNKEGLENSWAYSPNETPQPAPQGSMPAPQPTPQPAPQGSMPAPQPAPQPVDATSAPAPQPNPTPASQSTPASQPAPAEVKPEQGYSWAQPTPAPQPVDATPAPQPVPAQGQAQGQAPQPTPAPQPTSQPKQERVKETPKPQPKPHSPNKQAGFSNHVNKAPQKPQEQIGFFANLTKELVNNGEGSLGSIAQGDREEIANEVHKVTELIEKNGGTAQNMQDFAEQVYNSDANTIEQVLNGFANMFTPKK